MKRLYILAFMALTSISLHAQESILRAELEARVDYMQEFRESENYGPLSGFKGRYILLRVDGQISEGFSYSLRQRINKPTTNLNLFDATDWIQVKYNKGPWEVAAGKQIVAIGGYEYDTSPVNLFFCSEYCSNLPCFQFGISGAYTFAEGNDMMTFQITESPFRRGSLNTADKSLLAYNLMWNGSHNWFSSICSVNMMEYMPGKFINYIALGGKFTFGEFAVELDWTNRATSLETLWGDDFTAMGDISWRPADALKVFVRAIYERNNSVTGDLCVSPGTDLVRAGAGIEYFPLKNNKNLRLHLNCCYTDGD
ncbi:MAG: porin, partial [Firmicutes bacterium]|nr:porin [Bacillota bacterium]